jgi:hypothetical protein
MEEISAGSAGDDLAEGVSMSARRILSGAPAVSFSRRK